ncbi:MAG TPA: hypothetical protein PKL80_07895, partial [Rectinema sp.]|nr:hypothetical protein [Rectinema sp.]
HPAKALASSEGTIDFPTPPLPLLTAINRFIVLLGFFFRENAHKRLLTPNLDRLFRAYANNIADRIEKNSSLCIALSEI